MKTKYIKLKTHIPHPDTVKLLAKLENYEATSMHSNLPIVWDSAIDFNVWDKWGNKFLDFSSGIFVTNVGHSRINQGLVNQIRKDLLYSYNFPTEIRAKFLEKLISITPPYLEKAFLMSAGTEATECAVKIMRLYGLNLFEVKRRILSLKNSMHGKTMLAERLRGETKKNRWAFNHSEDYPIVWNLPFPSDEYNINWVKKVYWDTVKIAGIIIESYQGWSGRFYPKQYIQDLVKWAKENNILVCFDEVQGGFWRTGKQFAYQWYEVEPDLICLGKALGGGTPISAVIGRRELIDLPNDLSSTFSGNPLCCAGALHSLELLEQLNKKDLEDKSNFFGNALAIISGIHHHVIKEFNHKGMLGAVIFNNEEMANKVCYSAMQKGLILVKTGRESVKLGPPLTISKEALIEGLDVFEKVIEEVSHEK